MADTTFGPRGWTPKLLGPQNGPFDDFLIGVVDRALSSIARLDLSGWHTVNSAGQSPEETAEAVFALVQ